MSGMAGNVTAFNTVWTYDIYQGYINKKGTDAHYLKMGRMGDGGGDSAVDLRGVCGDQRSTTLWIRCSWSSRL
jgi:hypothetical protein